MSEQQFTIQTPAQWAAAQDLVNIRIREDGVGLETSLSYDYRDALQTGGYPVRSLALDRCGVLNIISDDSRLYVQTASPVTPFEPLPCVSLSEPVSLALGRDDYYVVQRTLAPGHPTGWVLVCRARMNHQVRRTFDVAPGMKIAACGDYGIILLDTLAMRIYHVPHYGQWRLREIVPLDDLGQPYPFTCPIDIAADGEGNLYILEELDSRIITFAANGSWLQTIAVPFRDDTRYTALAVDNLNSPATLFLGALDSMDNHFVLKLEPFDAHAVNGVIIGSPLDSRIQDCPWHRILLDAIVPDNTQIVFSYFASPDLIEPAQLDFHAASIIRNPWDALLIHARGRYLYYKIQLTPHQTRRTAPFIRKLTVHYPRDSYLRYLPQTYHEDPAAADFTQRFLSLFQTFMQENRETFLQFDQYLDVETVPFPFLPWLSRFLALTHDGNWSQAQQRQLAAQAPQLYKKRGTPAVLSRIVEIYYGTAPFIIEPFHRDCIQNPQHRDLFQTLFGTDPFRFTLLVPPRWHDPDAGVHVPLHIDHTQRAALQRILDAEKPAHTEGVLILLEPAIYLDIHTYLGINSLLGGRDFRLGQTAVLGRDTVTYDHECSAQVERNSRVGIMFKLT